jgi:hypothetical protein
MVSTGLTLGADSQSNGQKLREEAEGFRDMSFLSEEY